MAPNNSIRTWLRPGFPAAFFLCALPVWSQDAITCGGAPMTTGDFYTNFANSTYQIPIPKVSGALAAGDLNSTYFTLYYSIANANATPCKFELVVVGTFPDARYFSIADNDMHSAVGEHLADADIDPVNTSMTNPFVPDSSGQSPPYNGNQQYLVPISLGTVPGAKVQPGCAIAPFEEDNLLDATQRHLSMDWNSSYTPSIANALSAHVVDTPSHSNPNTAGSIIVRSYLSPETCTGTPGSLSCFQSPAPPQPFAILRDATTGCAYAKNYLESNNLINFKQLNCAQNPPAGCGAILSATDLSATNVPNWLDVAQKTQHNDEANITPQACYADGDPTLASPLPFANRVAWTRIAQWEGSPSPDDSYVGGAVSQNDLAGMPAGSACAQKKTGDGCVMRFRFRIPDMPGTPCPSPYLCSLSSSAQLRYMSLTFYYQTAPPPNADPNGIHPEVGYSPVSIVSLADPAFATAGSQHYATLIVNAGATLPAWLRLTATGAAGATQGVQPVTNKNNSYSVWTVNGYTVLDLSQMATFYTTYPLLVTLRNTLPGATFYCSGAAVPFSTAEYTNADGNGGGLMGPYVPLVDYVDPNYLPQSAPPTNLPAESSCGVLPSAQPGFNSPTLSNQVDFPNQYWSSTAPATPPNLYCPASQSSASSTAIYFVATQFPTPALTEFGAAACLTQPNSCSQIVVQSPQTSELGNGTWPPPLPLTIVGTGFGVLPQSLPTAVQGSPYLEIHNAEASGGTWDTAATTYCQMYIANWTNTSISLVANLPVGVRDMYSSTVLSPLSDVGPWTFPAAPGCPVASADKLTFTVTNPQSGARVTISSIQVDPAGTTLF